MVRPKTQHIASCVALLITVGSTIPLGRIVAARPWVVHIGMAGKVYASRWPSNVEQVLGKFDTREEAEEAMFNMLKTVPEHEWDRVFPAQWLHLMKQRIYNEETVNWYNEAQGGE